MHACACTHVHAHKSAHALYIWFPSQPFLLFVRSSFNQLIGWLVPIFLKFIGVFFTVIVENKYFVDSAIKFQKAIRIYPDARRNVR